jgi:non-homologous end joining protein Ku
MSPRKFVGDFSINLNIVTDTGVIALASRGALYPVASSEKDSGRSTNSFCPVHGAKKPVRIKQQLFCPENPNHGPFASYDDCLKGREVDGVVIAVDSEVIKAAKESALPKNVLDLSIFEYTDLMTQVYALGTAYFYVPDRVDDSYKILCGAVWSYNGEYAFAGQCNLRNIEKLISLVPHGEGFVVQQLTYPEHLNDVVCPEIEIDTDVMGHLGSLFESEVQEFDPLNFVDSTKARLEQALRSASGTAPTKTVKKVMVSGDSSLMDLITKSVAKVQAEKKTPVKRQPRKRAAS